MLRSRHIGTILILALAVEVAAFVAVVDRFGLGVALLIGLGATLLGFARLRLIGTTALGRLRGFVEGRSTREDAVLDGMLEALGAVLLILPGFVTDLVGLALLAPSVREGVRRRLGGPAGTVGTARGDVPRATDGPRTIDLEATDWTRLDRASGR